MNGSHYKLSPEDGVSTPPTFSGQRIQRMVKLAQGRTAGNADGRPETWP